MPCWGRPFVATCAVAPRSFPRWMTTFNRFRLRRPLLPRCRRSARHTARRTGPIGSPVWGRRGGGRVDEANIDETNIGGANRRNRRRRARPGRSGRAGKEFAGHSLCVIKNVARGRAGPLQHTPSDRPKDARPYSAKQNGAGRWYSCRPRGLRLGTAGAIPVAKVVAPPGERTPRSTDRQSGFPTSHRRSDPRGEGGGPGSQIIRKPLQEIRFPRRSRRSSPGHSRRGAIAAGRSAGRRHRRA